MQFDFWTGFKEFVSDNGSIVRTTAPPYPQSFLVVVGSREMGRSGFTLEAAMNTREGYMRAAIELKGNHTTHYFDLLHADRAAIEDEIGEELVWHKPPGRQRRSMESRMATDFMDSNQWGEQYRWLLDRIEALHRILAPRIRELPAPR